MRYGLPNLLTISRIIVIPVVVCLGYMSSTTSHILAACLFMIACFTDFLDGYFARIWHQTTSLGRFLDPIADKLLVAATLLMLVELERIRGLSLIPALIILCREILVSGLREFLAELHVPLPVSRLAKWKTALQMIALGCLLMSPAAFYKIPLQTLGLIGLWSAAILTVITGYDYLKASLRHMEA